MSHYTVAVITHTGEYDEVADLLAPYDENLEVESYVWRTREQIIKDGKARKEEWLGHIANENTTKAEAIQWLTEPDYKWLRDLMSAETDDDFYWSEANSDYLHADGNEYTTYNPDSKWDWYQIGGRWSGSLLSKEDGNHYDTLQIKDWDYDIFNTESVEHYERFWEVAAEGAEQTEKEKENHEFFLRYKPEYYLEKYGSKSNFIKCMCTFSTYAVLTPDGEWLAPGNMGWWGISNADVKDEFEWERDYIDLINTFDPEMYITIVDCHI